MGLVVLHWREIIRGYKRNRERSVWVIEAKSLEIEDAEFDSNIPGDKTPGIEDAKTFPLTKMTPPIGFIKLNNLFRSNFNRSCLKENEFVDQMTQLIAGKARGDAATDTGVYLPELSEVLISELDFQQDKIMKQTGCRVTLQPTGRLI